MLAHELGVARDCWSRHEVQITLERKAHRAAGGSELVKADVTEFQLPESHVAKTEDQMPVGLVQLRKEPRGAAIRGEELDDRFEVDSADILVKRRALGAPVVQ